MALAPCVVITAALSSYRGYMQGKMNMKAIGVSQILEQILNVFVSLLFAFILVQFSLNMVQQEDKLVPLLELYLLVFI